jgi:hypothetical protein
MHLHSQSWRTVSAEFHPCVEGSNRNLQEGIGGGVERICRHMVTPPDHSCAALHVPFRVYVYTSNVSSPIISRSIFVMHTNNATTMMS